MTGKRAIHIPTAAKAAAKAVAKEAKAAKAVAKEAKAVAKKPPTVPKVAKAAKAVAKKPLKDTKIAKATVPKTSKATKTVVNKPPTVPKISKATKAVMKKSKTQIYRGSGCSGFFCFSKGKVEVYPPQPVAPQPVAPQPDNLINTSLSDRNKNMFLISNKKEYEVKERNGCNISNPYPFQLTKKVGDKQIYTTTINIDSNTYEIVIKVMKYKKYNLLEKNIMIAIRDQIISKNNSKHFLLIYFYSLCHNGNDLELRTYNEPVENSLRDLIIKDYGLNLLDDYTFHNLLIQSLLSIGSFHNLTGYVHMDTHTGNFLYAKNSEHNPEGYYQYSFGDGEIYYLKSCGYNVMIYDFGYSNKIDIPIDKIKRFELLYDDEDEDDNEDGKKEKNIIRDFIVLNNQYSEIDIRRLGKMTSKQLTYVNEIAQVFGSINDYANYYRIKILIDDYGIFLQGLRVFFVEDDDVVENRGRLETIDTIKEKIEKIKKNYLDLPPDTITDAQFYGYAKDIFKRVLDICITHFPKIFSKKELKKETKSMFPTLFGRPSQQPSPQHILNTQPYLLYQPTKITVQEPIITQ
jgi:hypothetical protein